MLSPQNIPLLEEFSLDKLKKFELVAMTLSYTSDMLLCYIPAYVKSTIVDKLALNPIERYSQEINKDWFHSDQSLRPSHPITLEVIQHLISFETCSGTSYNDVIESLKSIRISFDINRAKSLNETSMSIHKYLTHGGLPPEILEDIHINKIICDCLTEKLKYLNTHIAF